tara:strand:+ start:145 stop:411 length:267 start_codon:yes stop_codon:yes gene_type:complete
MSRKPKSEEILSKEEKISKGTASESVLQSPVFLEVFEKLEDQFISQWMSSQDEDAPKRERLYLSLKVLSEIRIRLESNVTSKILAERQ